MGKLSIKGGTPVGSEPLCRSCSHAHIFSGYRESEMMVVCTFTYPDIPVPFVVRECSGYNDRSRPDWEQMEKLAIPVQKPVSFAKKVGFRTDSDRLEESSDPHNND